MRCSHERFASRVVVVRQVNPAGIATHYKVEIEIKCMECGLPFKLLVPDDSVRLRPSSSMETIQATIPIIPGDYNQSDPDDLPLGNMNERT